MTKHAARPRVGISACLLGSRVRYDGGHRRDPYCAEVLPTVLELIPVCPEVEAGLGVPRPTIQLRRIGHQIRLVRSDDDAVDVTGAIGAVAECRNSTLDQLSGFILKHRSPSCGTREVPVSDANGEPLDRSGTGVFARRFAELRPLVPLEEEGRLDDPLLRENFLRRVFALHRWYQLAADDAAGFMAFHAAHEQMSMAGDRDHFDQLGRLTTDLTAANLSDRRARYIGELMSVLAR